MTGTPTSDPVGRGSDEPVGWVDRRHLLLGAFAEVVAQDNVLSRVQP